MSQGNIVKQVREELGLTQTALSERMGFNRSYLNQVESGKRPVTRAIIKSLEVLRAGVTNGPPMQQGVEKRSKEEAEFSGLVQEDNARYAERMVAFRRVERERMTAEEMRRAAIEHVIDYFAEAGRLEDMDGLSVALYNVRQRLPLADFNDPNRREK